MQDKKLIFETTSKCNLNCKYCYMPEESTETSLQVFEKAIEKFVKYNSKYLLVTFHGGEALTVGIDKFKKFMDLEERLNDKKLIIKNNIQTNGVLINQKWIDFFRQNNFHVGISIDGPEEVHNKNRVYSNGKGSYSQVMESISLLKEEKIPFGTITVLTKDSFGKEREIYKTIKETSALSSKINFYSSAGKGSRYQNELELNSEEKFQIMKAFYDLYKEDDNRPLRLSPFDRIIESFFTGKNSICEYNGKCNIESILFIDNKGDIYPCGRFIGNEFAKLGNVFLNELDEIEKSPFYQYNLMRNEKSSEISNLPFFRFHKLGCVYESISKNKNPKTISSDYEFKEKLIQYIYRDIQRRINVP